ncbi:hypothetical protein [Methylopila sp. Yamaguchi]|uniref:hypothetical protein n=1 Tax=Methylopila sp. Yamaguchi TaxID=1437817 RepID=UPI000CA989EC|nr:hypothetical protein [Methylopila sp. Yamaguchi]GBD48115.1 hypothetical protein METY_1328 [Methylopila sp. Yamaguchi]
MEFLNDVWAGLRPYAVEAAVTIGAALLAYAGAKALETLKAIKDEKLALSLYRTIENLLKAALARRALAGSAIGPEVTGQILKEVLEGTKAVNPKSVTGLKQSDAALVDKITARLPEAKAAVVTAAAVAEAAKVA